MHDTFHIIPLEPNINSRAFGPLVDMLYGMDDLYCVTPAVTSWK
jgi:hypothetical protein